jgi:chitinase
VLQAHTSQADWTPPATPALFQQLSCGGPTATFTRTNTPAGPTATFTRTNTPGAATFTPTKTATKTNTPVGPTATFTRTNTPSGPTLTPTRTPTSGGGGSCAVKTAPSGKVLQGYWESWDGSSVHPGMGHIAIGQVPAAYNVIMAAFPVILSDGTAVWADGMDVGVDVPTPQEICNVKAAGHWVLLSIGGAAAGIDLSSSTVADKFIATIVPILQANNFDGIDIDIESGLVAGANYNSLSTSQSNLIRIIDGVLSHMPSNFMLTMAPETAYVTGGQIAYGGPWGAYLPIIGKYRDNGRLSWLNMQYYNGNMYGCPATSFSAGTVQGFVEQTKCLNNGFQAGGVTFSLPYSKQVPGLPAQSGAGGGYMVPADVTAAYNQVSAIKGLMTWSINWDGSKGWTFMNNKPY